MKINNDPHGLKAWRVKNYEKKPRKSIWEVLLNPPKTDKEG